MNNYNTAICIVGICLVITALLIFINHLRTKKTIDTIENMLNEAAKGNFSEKSFDETRLCHNGLFLSLFKCEFVL